MGLKTKAQFVESLRDGRQNFWNGERIDDITVHPRFRVPIEVASSDYAYDDPDLRDIITYQAEDGSLSHRVYQVPRSEEDLHKRMELLRHMSIVGGVTGVFMALLQVVDPLRKVNPAYADNIERMSRTTLISIFVSWNETRMVSSCAAQSCTSPQRQLCMNLS